MVKMARQIKAEDKPVIRDWYRGWNLKPVSCDMLPPTGMIVPGICAGYLYLTNAPGFGFVEGFISNPECSKELRDEALNELTFSLVALAKDYGVSVLRAETRNASVVNRALKFNFVEQTPQRSFVRRVV